jgi:gamma-glutamyltranspeptidase/glutathione hydrolase
MPGGRHGGGGGAIAAGHPASTRAGADVLARGGNAADALVAAVVASWAAEPTVSGPCGGGFCLYRDAVSGRTTLLDFFAAVPGLDAHGPRRPMDSFDVHFGTAIQRFHIGVGSCAVPGTAAGVGLVHRSFGSLSWGGLVAPAIALARDGVVTNEAHARLNAILVPVVTATPGAREVWAPAGRVLVEGEVMRQTRLATTLERVADAGTDDLYRGRLAGEIAGHLAAEGGAVTAADLAAYRVVRRRPVRATFRGHELVTNAPPSSGGLLLAYALAIHDRLPRVADPRSAGALHQLAAVLREAEGRRGAGLARRLAHGGARRLLEPAAVAAGVDRVRAALVAGPTPSILMPTPRGTTHVSVIDARGNAASLTSSTGCGSGVFIGDTGLHLNNMLGEEDLTGHGALAIGSRLTSMMAPSVVEGPDGLLAVLGSSGSARIRSALHRVVSAVVEYGLDPREAVDLPRIHVTADGLDCEHGFEPAVLDELEALGERVVRWPDRNLYFGGAQVAVARGGRLLAAGDPRRGGDSAVVIA